MGGFVILGVSLIIRKSKDIRARISSFLKSRISTQEFHNPSCGCVFKNPSNKSAGFLIESCGLTGFSKGDACISKKHANFIVNLGKASYKDVDYLIQAIKEKVHTKHNIILEEEIKRWV